MSDAVLRTTAIDPKGPMSDWDSQLIKLPMINPFAGGAERFRYPVAISEATKITVQGSSPTYGSTSVMFPISKGVASGLCDLATLFLVFTPNAVTGVTGGTPSYIDGHVLRLIKSLKLMISGQEIIKMDYSSIYQYYQRFDPKQRQAYYDMAKIGAAGSVLLADYAGGVQQTLLIPLPFSAKYSLRTNLLANDTCYILCDFEQINKLTILGGGTGATRACSFADIHMDVSYIRFPPDIERDIITRAPPSQITWFSDYQNETSQLTTGATRSSHQLTFGESEYLMFYIENNYATDAIPFTPIEITKYYVTINTENYPAQVSSFSAKEMNLDAIRYFGFPIESLCYFLSFSHVPSELETESAIETFQGPSTTFGTIIFKNRTVYLNLEFAALSGACILHIFSFSRAKFIYDGMRMQKFVRGS